MQTEKRKDRLCSLNGKGYRCDLACALVNAFRHANAISIETEIAYLRNQLRVVVRDNGCGIDAEIVQSGRVSHWDLVGMRERAKGIGAEVRICSRRGAGTEVRHVDLRPRSLLGQS